MMIIIKTKEEINLMREAGILLASCHQEVAKLIKPGISTHEIDQFVEQYLLDHGATAEQKGYHGYPFATCGSVNDVICHGFPSKEPMKNGDIVTIDFVVRLNGWLADSAWSYRVGEVSEQADNLLKVTEASMYKGIEQAVIGNRIGDVANAIQRFAEKAGYSVVRNFCGHGIGQDMHESPQVAHFGLPGQGALLKEGMVLTIEPMLNVGTFHCKIDADGWTARTKDGKLSAQYEHTLAITKEGPFILTKL
jgi:methionyl aminopeptidase